MRRTTRIAFIGAMMAASTVFAANLPGKPVESEDKDCYLACTQHKADGDCGKTELVCKKQAATPVKPKPKSKARKH